VLGKVTQKKWVKVRAASNCISNGSGKTACFGQHLTQKRSAHRLQVSKLETRLKETVKGVTPATLGDSERWTSAIKYL
jgi:hypothetical protein